MAFAMTKEQGRIIRLARVKKGWNQQDLGERTGIVQSLISRYENGVRSIPKPDLKKIKRALSLRDEDLMPDADERIFTEILDERRDRRRDVVKKDFLHFLRELDKLGSRLREITQGEIEVPVISDIPAGSPSPILDDEYTIRTETFPQGWVETERVFGLKILDDSMNGLGLMQGDIVFINRDDNEVTGKGKVMAAGTKEGLIIRTVVRIGDRLRLIAENPRFEVLELDPDIVFIYGTLLKFMVKAKLE
jgi:SOS-response transcriptional repressor LexA